MIPHARLRPGPGFQPGKAALYFFQRFTTFPFVRQTISRTIARAIQIRQGPSAWGGSRPQDVAVASSLREQGLAMLPEFVSEARATVLLNYFRDKDVVGADGRLTPLDRLLPDAAMASYPLRTILQSPDALNVINAPAVLRVVEAYLGCKPTLSSLGVRWSFPTGRQGVGTQQFHRDPVDWRFLKLFVYLTDVDAGAGPHAFVTGSHRTAGRLRNRHYSRAFIERHYGIDGVRTITGRRGTAFIADTYGIHAGVVPTCTPRLILQAQYSLLPVFAFRYEPPVQNVVSGLDAYVNRLLVAQRACRRGTCQTCRLCPV
jgi:hypothetical protein